jgi:hypothetical protein
MTPRDKDVMGDEFCFTARTQINRLCLRGWPRIMCGR